jgi:SAM-dependent methyltransferase
MQNFHEWLENFHPEEIIKVNKSFDDHGFDSSISLKDIMPLLNNKIKQHHNILDYGAGRIPKISRILQGLGLNVIPHEIGINQNSNHDKDALSKKYDTVIALNVLNHLPDHDKIADSLGEVKGVLNPGGCCIATLPKQPRAMSIKRGRLKETLDDLFPKHQVKTHPDKGSILILES